MKNKFYQEESFAVSWSFAITSKTVFDEDIFTAQEDAYAKIGSVTGLDQVHHPLVQASSARRWSLQTANWDGSSPIDQSSLSTESMILH